MRLNNYHTHLFRIKLRWFSETTWITILRTPMDPVNPRWLRSWLSVLQASLCVRLISTKLSTTVLKRLRYHWLSQITRRLKLWRLTVAYLVNLPKKFKLSYSMVRMIQTQRKSNRLQLQTITNTSWTRLACRKMIFSVISFWPPVNTNHFSPVPTKKRKKSSIVSAME